MHTFFSADAAVSSLFNYFLFSLIFSLTLSLSHSVTKACSCPPLAPPTSSGPMPMDEERSVPTICPEPPDDGHPDSLSPADTTPAASTTDTDSSASPTPTPCLDTGEHVGRLAWGTQTPPSIMTMQRLLPLPACVCT